MSGVEAVNPEFRLWGWSAGRWLLVILIVAFVLRATFSFGVARGLQHIEPQQQSTDEYHLIAESLYAGKGYRFNEVESLTLQRPPGYPAFLLGVFSVSGVDYAVVQVVQAALGAVTCLLLFLLGRWIMGPALGLVAAAMFALYPNAIEYSSRLYVETLYFPFLVAFALLLCVASLRKSWGWGVGAGLVWAMGLLIRGTMMAAPPFLAAGLLLSRAHRSDVPAVARWVAAGALAASIVMAPWVVRNYRLTGEIVPVSTVSWTAIYNGLQVSKHATEWRDLAQVDVDAATYAHERFVAKFHAGNGALAYRRPIDSVHYSGLAKELVLEEWGANPARTVWHAARGTVFTWFFAFGKNTRLLSLAI
ncbi:MAG: glycosyltransferase family 39 protein, partial [Steroidobacteraceae bacterium]